MNFRDAILSGRPMLTEGAIVERLKHEFNIKLDAFVNHAGIIYHPQYAKILEGIYQEYIEIAATYELPVMLMTPTRRANKSRVKRSAFHDRNLNYDCVNFVKKLRSSRDLSSEEIYVGGLMGCKGDAYSIDEVLSVKDAHEFHSWQAAELCNAGTDYLFAGIMPALSEATGMAMAMCDTRMPYIISFMIESNGQLLDGTNINDAIIQIDLATKYSPVCYMANCVHPAVLGKALSAVPNRTQVVKSRFSGLQANTSALRYEELNNATGLKTEDPGIFAKDMENLDRLHHLNIYGGCCGTNKLHIEKIAAFMKSRLTFGN